MAMISMRPATSQDRDVLFHLMQFYFFESSAWSGEDVGADGHYDCTADDVASSLAGSPGWAHLLHVDGQVAGFVLVDEADFAGTAYPELADLFVLPKYRGKGVAVHAATALLAPASGPWLLAVFKRDLQAYAYWRRALPRLGVAFEEQPEPAQGDFRFFLLKTASAHGRG
jgi:predicted acetyltransferase